MRTEEFDFELPEELIAQQPLEDRAASRLLVLNRKTGSIHHRTFRDVTRILGSGDLLVMNDTRVTARRLMGHRETGAVVEALVLRRAGNEWEALMRPAKKLRPGESIEFESGLTGTVTQDLGAGLKKIRFVDENGSNVDLTNYGQTPLPPYIHSRLLDDERYQTVYSSEPGSAAAPTAGLHLTPEVIQGLKSAGVAMAKVTLDVGLDTFRQVSVDVIEDHNIHGETCRVPQETADAVRACQGRVIAVGTTSTRTLESMATGLRQVRAGSISTKLFVTPGYQFQIIDGMLTNFHLPRTTMLFMLAALVGKDNLLKAYKEAIEHNYRFLSFGDSMLVI